MNEKEVCSYLQEEGRKKGMVLGLDTMRQLMKELGNPQDRFLSIQLAGTNGKGSCAAYLEQILIKAGYRVGKYTSPAVFDRMEQYRINGKETSMTAFCEVITKIAAVCDSMERELSVRPTVFEQETAAAFCLFAESGCEYVVLETGLGGDEDATNVVTKTICSLITSISFDHKRILGNTLTEIAGHKAGIIKQHGRAVVMKQNDEVMQVIEAVCREQKVKLSIADPKQAVVLLCDNGMEISYRGYHGLRTTQRAIWQASNLTVVLEAVEALKETGCKITEEAVRQGVEAMEWRGRFECRRLTVNGQRKWLILDGAHNPDGARALREALDQCFPTETLCFVIGVLADKEYEIVLEQLLGRAASVYTVASDSPRALSAKQLAQAVCEKYPTLPVAAMPTEEQAMPLSKEASRQAVFAALEKAMKQTEEGVVVCGSLSFMESVDKWLKQAESCTL